MTIHSPFAAFVKGASRAAIVSTVLASTAGSASAAVVGFADQPTANRAAWTSTVAGWGATIDATMNFDEMRTGAMRSDFYLSRLGVTLTPVGDVVNIVFGQGPSNGDVTTGPISFGEGQHRASNLLYDGFGLSSLTISFANPVNGVGLYLIDYFNPRGDNPITLEAFDANGGSLGAVHAAAYNFQNDYLYFLGLARREGDIRSVVLSDLSSAYQDTIGIDDILFAFGAAPPPPPPPPPPGPTEVTRVSAPATLPLLSAALIGFAAVRRRI
jgi:hypothetical protein